MKINIKLLPLTLVILGYVGNTYADHGNDHHDKAMMGYETGDSATNTKNNVRDNSGSTVLPENQSNKKEYIDRTATIRSEILANDKLSLNARNIKIVTLDNGAIFLRGPVNSSDEKSQIEAIAKKLSNGSSVKSFLEVTH